MYTDDPVTINGKGVKIVGQGCEIDLINKKMWIKKMRKWRWTESKRPLFPVKGQCFTKRCSNFSGRRNSFRETGTKETPLEKTFIRSSGQLIFDRNTDANIMTFNDNVEVKKAVRQFFLTNWSFISTRKRDKRSRPLPVEMCLYLREQELPRGVFSPGMLILNVQSWRMITRRNSSRMT